MLNRGRISWTEFRKGHLMWKVGVLLCVACLVLVGCEMAKRVDQAIWQSPVPEIEGEAPPPPPIVEIVAGLLAAGGFGGMAGWLRKQGNGTRRSIAALGARIAILEVAVTEKALRQASQ